MRTLSFLLLILFAILNYQCNTEKCFAEPIAIEFNEHLKVQILNLENESIFTNDYLLDDLEVYEDGNLIEHQLDNVSAPQLGTLSLPLSITKANILNENFGNEITTTLQFKYNNTETDTLEVKLLPIDEDENCNKFYDNIELVYNSTVIKTVTRQSCISCKTPIVLIKI